MNYASTQVSPYHSLFKTLDFHATFLHRSSLMKNSFALSTAKCTDFTGVLAQVLLVAECCVYFRLRLWTGPRPGAEELLIRWGPNQTPETWSFLLSEAQSASQASWERILTSTFEEEQSKIKLLILLLNIYKLLSRHLKPYSYHADSVPLINLGNVRSFPTHLEQEPLW